MENTVLVVIIVALSFLDIVFTTMIFDRSPGTAVELNPIYGEAPSKKDITKMGLLCRVGLAIILVLLVMFVDHPVLAKLLYAMAGYWIAVGLKNWFVIRHFKKG